MIPRTKVGQLIRGTPVALRMPPNGQPLTHNQDPKRTFDRGRLSGLERSLKIMTNTAMRSTWARKHEIRIMLAISVSGYPDTPRGRFVDKYRPPFRRSHVGPSMEFVRVLGGSH
jgi:hypothetical protein